MGAEVASWKMRRGEKTAVRRGRGPEQTLPLEPSGGSAPYTAGPGSGTSRLQNHEKINACSLSHPVCAALLQMCHPCVSSYHVFFLSFLFFPLQLIYNVLSFSAVQQSDPVVRSRYILSVTLSSILFHQRRLDGGPCAVQQELTYHVFL